ncbi:PCF11P-similar protein 4 [Hibiscus syriacus]|uniref:PCF11P-similar protein 4 n=1 Tax=Hibiscus syriacus TaxID=106335 RepID=A0A6A2X6S9_HIBSY|nr:PCF11P-similar protein 4 [Hibiscus syriacus]
MDNAEVRSWSEETQRKKRDSLTEDYISILPEVAPVSLKQNDLQELREIWESWNSDVKYSFWKKYGDIALLLYVKDSLSKASRTQSFKSKLARITGMGEKWVADQIQKKRESDYFPWSCIKELIVKHRDIEKRMEMFSLGIYCLMIFPKVLYHVEAAVVDLFERLERKVNHVPTVLAETFRALSSCRRAESSRFTGDSDWVTLLGLWGRVAYAPLMILKQFGARQFVPATSGLKTSEFVYCRDHYKKIARAISDTWKPTFRTDLVAAENSRLRGIVELETSELKESVESEKKKRNQELESERRSWVRALKSERTEAKELRPRYTLSKKQEEELRANIEKLRMKASSMKHELEIRKCGVKNERIEVLNQEMHEMKSRHEEELARAKEKNEEYSAYVMQLESSLFAKSSQRCPTDQSVGLEESATRQKKIHDLEAALRSCQTQIAGLECTIQGTRVQWQNSNDHFRDRKTNVNHVIRETMNQVSGITRQLGEMNLQAKVIQSYTNLASDIGKRVYWLVNEIVELNIRARPFLILGPSKHPYNTRKRAMDDKIAQIEKTQLQLQDDLRKMQEDMLKAQEDMLSKLESMLGSRNPEHGKAHETYHQVPDLDEESKKNESKLLREQYKQLANEVQAMKEDTSLYGLDAKELTIDPLFPTKLDRLNNAMAQQNGVASNGKKHNESFRQYTQSWREVAVQVHPPLEARGRRVQQEIANEEEGKQSQQVRQYDSHNITVSRPQGTAAPPQIDNRQGARDPRRERPQFDPIPITYKELFHELYDRYVVSPYYVDPIQPPYPKWYDVSAKLEYHAGVSGYSIENCSAFKKVVQALRRRNVINFVAKEKGRMTIKNVSEVISPMSWVWYQMVKVGLLKTNLQCEQFTNEEMCHYHNCTGHSIQQCPDFLGLVQEMMDSKEIEFFKEVAEEEEAEVYAFEGSSKGVYNASCPFFITPKNRVAENVAPKVIITPLSPFPYKDNKQVPWRYTCQIGEVAKQQEEVDEVGHMTRSEAHRDALLKVLNQTFIPKEIPTEKLDRLVANIQADNFLSFSEDEIPSGKISNHKAMHISFRCKGHVLSRVLIDNGSALNVMPLVTLKKLPVDMEFLVMDIMPTYNCLLGRPWIHQAGAVPSTLHQRIKFAIDGRLICIHAEEDIIASVSTTAPYVEVEEQAVECSFRSLEYVNAMFVAEGKKIPKPRLSNCTKMGLKLTLGRGAKTGKGLGLRLGYMFQGALGSSQVIVENALGDLSVNVITDEELKEVRATGIYPAPPGFVLTNWTAEELPVVYKSFAENSYINDTNANDSDPEIDFEIPICQGEVEGCDDDEGCELPSELLKMVEQEDKQILPHEELTEILNLGTDEDRKEVKIVTTLTVEGRHSLIELLQEFENVFAWSYKDMPGLDTELVVHKLPIKPDCKPVHQKLRRMRPEMLLKIKEEVKKQLDVGFLTVAKYPEWVANIIPVPKKDGKIRWWTILLEIPYSHSWMASLAIIIKMYPEDMEKTMFATMWGTFCYKVMPFGLKNAGVTYQRAMVTIDEFWEALSKEWSEDCQEAFEAVKRYLSNTSILAPPIPGKPLILYLSVYENSMGCVLGQYDQTEKRERAIYYLSKKFTECEARYSPIEKLCCALLWATRRLRQYMLYHATWLISKLDPLKYLMGVPALSGRLARWKILLSEFDIQYLRGEWETKDPKLVEYRKLVLGLMEEFEEMTFNYLPREENQMADALDTLAAAFKMKEHSNMIPIGMKAYEYPAHFFNIEEEDDERPWCVDTKETKMILEEVHEGICGTHANRHCHKCQIYRDRMHTPPHPLHVMTALWSFSMWGMDVIGQILPKASNGHRFILVAIDYFTKYGLPERIISDNALNLNNKMMKSVCEQFKIKHHNSTVYRPKMNGAVEAANKNIKRLIEKMTETYKDWHEKLPFALFSYQTFVRTSTGATPFSLVYGMEVVLPIKVEIPSLRVLSKMYQKRMIQAHDKKVHPREIFEGDLVLRRILPIQKDFQEKWMPKWEGPYVVKKAFSGGALVLTEMDGSELPYPVNSDAVKRQSQPLIDDPKKLSVIKKLVMCTGGFQESKKSKSCQAESYNVEIINWGEMVKCSVPKTKPRSIENGVLLKNKVH